MNLDSRPMNKPKQGPSIDTQNPDLLINFQLTQQNTYITYKKHSKFTEINTNAQNLNLANDDDLVYSDNETFYDKVFMKEAVKSPQKNDFTVNKENRVLSYCMNSQNVKHQQKVNKKAQNTVKFQDSDLKLKFESRMKTQDGVEYASNKSLCFLTNQSVFFTNQTSRSELSSIRFKVKPKTSIKQIVQNIHKTERSSKAT